MADNQIDDERAFNHRWDQASNEESRLPDPDPEPRLRGDILVWQIMDAYLPKVMLQIVSITWGVIRLLSELLIVWPLSALLRRLPGREGVKEALDRYGR